MRNLVPPAALLSLLALVTVAARQTVAVKPVADIGCASLVEKLCDELFLPPSRGNLTVEDPRHPVRVRLGLQINGFERHELRELELRLEAMPKYPPDFSRVLKRMHYDVTIRSLLDLPDTTRGNESSRVRLWDLSREALSKWEQAVPETVHQRMLKRNPELAKIPSRALPPELVAEQNRQVRELRAEVNRITWSDSPEWRSILSLFEDIRADAIAVIADSKAVRTEEKTVLAAILSQASIIPPYSSTESLDHPCEPMGNARYDAATGRIWVCPENLTSHDPAWTLAHELGHAIGTMRESQRMRRESELGRAMMKLSGQLCRRESVECSEWAAIKSRYDSMLAAWRETKPWNRKLFSCLKSRDTRMPDRDRLQSLADDSARWILDDLAQHSSFLQLAKRVTLSPQGEPAQNPAWANPCNLDSPDGPEFPDEPFEGGRPSLLFFALETRCGQAGRSPAAFTQAIDQSFDLLSRYTLAQMRIEGDYSTLTVLNNGGYAEDVEEQVSDALASDILARRLARIPDTKLRRFSLIANIASLCERPGLQSLYRHEDEIEGRWARSESHSVGLRRIRETMRAPIRDALGCEKDFEQKECPL